jgi:hypothetical protein
MDFIGAYWWLWLVTGTVSVVCLIVFSSVRIRKAVKDAQKGNMNGVENAVKKTTIQTIGTVLIVASCWILFIISMFVNIAHYIVHLVKTA